MKRDILEKKIRLKELQKIEEAPFPFLKGNKNTGYVYFKTIGNYQYGVDHPMKPIRVQMANDLIIHYKLFENMHFYGPGIASKDEIVQFHSNDYIDFLRRVEPCNVYKFEKELNRFNLNEDCTVFEGMFEFCQYSAGGSIQCAKRLNHGQHEIMINYSGGLHHAKRSEASGFCYVNDIVLGILELLKYHKRVLYIDIDIHHGDGVEEAFYLSDRVMTCSFHKYGNYFPGTGDLLDTGHGKGKYHSVNFPLKDGMNDESYERVFKPVIDKIISTFDPGAIVLQCGADSLAGDRLGVFNLSIEGHGKCIEHVKKLGIPLMVLGGGGYTVRNVSRCWAYEAGILCGKKIDNNMPFNNYMEYFQPQNTIELVKREMKNMNSKEYLNKTMNAIFENLGKIKGPPSVQIQETPRDTVFESEVSSIDMEILKTDERFDEDPKFFKNL